MCIIILYSLILECKKLVSVEFVAVFSEVKVKTSRELKFILQTHVNIHNIIHVILKKVYVAIGL